MKTISNNCAPSASETKKGGGGRRGSHCSTPSNEWPFRSSSVNIKIICSIWSVRATETRDMNLPEDSETNIFLVARSTRLKAENGGIKLSRVERSGQKEEKSPRFFWRKHWDKTGSQNDWRVRTRSEHCRLRNCACGTALSGGDLVRSLMRGRDV